jgi:hypothetical protein
MKDEILFSLGFIYMIIGAAAVILSFIIGGSNDADLPPTISKPAAEYNSEEIDRQIKETDEFIKAAQIRYEKTEKEFAELNKEFDRLNKLQKLNQ